MAAVEVDYVTERVSQCEAQRPDPLPTAFYVVLRVTAVVVMLKSFSALGDWNSPNGAPQSAARADDFVGAEIRTR